MTQNTCQPRHGPQRGQIGPAFELFFRCADRKPLLDNDRWNRVLAEGLDEAFQRRDLKLAAFVFLPDCVRLIVVQQGDSVNMPRLLYVIKRRFSLWVREDLRQRGHTLRKELTVRDTPGSYRFRFWEPGPGQIRELGEASAIAEAVEAMHTSPVDERLCETPGQWKWSSWRQHQFPTQPPDPDLPRLQALPAVLSPTSAPGLVS